MLNENLYKAVSESLQDDINSGNVSYEYASIINDIAYKAYIEKEDLDENIRGVLDKYMTEAFGVYDNSVNDSIYESVVSSLQDDINCNKITYEYAQAINSLAYERYINNSVLTESAYDALSEYMIESTKDYGVKTSVDIADTVGNIYEAYKNDEISSHEADVLLEALQERVGDLSYYTESGKLGAIKGKIASAVNTWKETNKKGLSELKKKKEGKPFDKKVIQKMGAAGAALTMALSQTGCNMSSCKKEITKEVSKAERQIHSIDVYDYTDSGLNNISDELRESIYNAITKNDSSTNTFFNTVSDNENFLIGAGRDVNGKRRINIASLKKSGGPTDVRRLEKAVIDTAAKNSKDAQAELKLNTKYPLKDISSALDEIEKYIDEYDAKVKESKSSDDSKGYMRAVYQTKLDNAKTAKKELTTIFNTAKKLVDQEVSAKSYNDVVNELVKSSNHLSSNLEVVDMKS